MRAAYPLNNFLLVNVSCPETTQPIAVYNRACVGQVGNPMLSQAAYGEEVRALASDGGGQVVVELVDGNCYDSG